MTADRGGLFERGKRALDTLLQIAQLRLELLSTELEQEKLRLFDALLRALVGLLLLGLALVGLLAFVVMAFQEGWRLPALGLMTLALGGLGLWLLQAARSAGPAGCGGAGGCCAAGSACCSRAERDLAVPSGRSMRSIAPSRPG
jgi:uncharacterized membrane protein YqjE